MLKEARAGKCYHGRFIAQPLQMCARTHLSVASNFRRFLTLELLGFVNLRIISTLSLFIPVINLSQHKVLTCFSFDRVHSCLQFKESNLVVQVPRC